MAIYETHATASHRYYERKPKSEIRRRICDLARAARQPRPSDNELKDLTASELARMAMRLHDLLPNE